MKFEYVPAFKIGLVMLVWYLPVVPLSASVPVPSAVAPWKKLMVSPARSEKSEAGEPAGRSAVAVIVNVVP